MAEVIQVKVSAETREAEEKLKRAQVLIWQMVLEQEDILLSEGRICLVKL